MRIRALVRWSAISFETTANKPVQGEPSLFLGIDEALHLGDLRLEQVQPLVPLLEYGEPLFEAVAHLLDALIGLRRATALLQALFDRAKFVLALIEGPLPVFQLGQLLFH